MANNKVDQYRSKQFKKYLQQTDDLMLSEGFILEPKTVEEFQSNAHFQLANVYGWMGVDYEVALIKAQCLVAALEKVVEQTQKSE